MKRITKSREFLQADCRVSEVDGKFYQLTTKVGLKELKPFTSIAKHKYGTDLPYEYITFYNYTKKKYVLMSYHSFLYAWYKGEVPAGYDVDHIDGDTMNNHIDNLQILTHEENIKKRGSHQNQYTKAKELGIEVKIVRSKEYIEKHEQMRKEREEKKAKEREEWLSNSEERKELQLKKKRITTLKKQIKRLEDEILHYRTKDEFHSEDWLNRKVKELSEDIVTKRAELVDLESSIC